jgi:hypothetical protein
MRIEATIDTVGTLNFNDEGFDLRYDYNGVKFEVNLTIEDIEHYADVLSGRIPSKILPPSFQQRFRHGKVNCC